MKYIVGIDQSTQGTKAVLFDETGKLLRRADKKHRQLVSKQGWVSHDLNEIYENTIAVFKELIEQTEVDKNEIVSVGISNQRETTAMWNKDGVPVALAIVWQCSRAEQIVKRLSDNKDLVYEKTGIPLSPYFSAAKMRWLLENAKDGTAGNEICLGTIDSWLIYKLTSGKRFATDVSNASRTQLFNLHTLSWDEELCKLFGIPLSMLGEICDSNADFGSTDFDGYLEHKIPIHAVMGDSHAALFGQGCHSMGMGKATYGTGSSIMMNTGSRCIKSTAGLITSLAWGMDGKVDYVLEGNINYAGAVITWMQEELGLIYSPDEIEPLLQSANKADQTVLIPAFSGLGAPYWNDEARAMFYGMGRTTGKAELVKAAVESIAFQVSDVITAMEKDLAQPVTQLRVDGGPTKNRYLMQFESDMTGSKILVSKQEELSAIGAAYMAGIAAGVYEKTEVFSNLCYSSYEPKMAEQTKKRKKKQWEEAAALLIK